MIQRLIQTVRDQRESSRRALGVVSILLLVGMLIAVPVAAQTAFYSEDFEGVAAGTTPPDWTGGTVEEINGENHHTVTDNVREFYVGEINTSELYVEAEIMRVDTDDGAALLIYDDLGDTVWRVRVVESQNILDPDGSGIPTGTEISFSDWGPDGAVKIALERQGDMLRIKSWHPEDSPPDTWDATFTLSAGQAITDARVGHSAEGTGETSAINYLTIAARSSLADSYVVSGTVTDQDGDPINNATVEITDSAGESAATTTTATDGDYSTRLPNGSYSATVSKDGYSPETQSFEVAGERVRLDFELAEERLRLDTRPLYKPGATHPYSVLYVDGNGSEDVTDAATVTSSNMSILTVNDDETMTAVDDENVSQVVTVNVSYQSYTASEEIVVAAATVENLAILPTGITRTEAIFGDDTIFALLIAALLSVPASRFANAFAGLGVAEMVIVVGWLGGFVGLGIAMLSIFVAMFVGLNLAENVEFTTRGGVGGRF